MIRLKEKKSITWLLIAGMLHLMLITAPSGMVMASPSETVTIENAQPADMKMPACHTEAMATPDKSILSSDCSNCQNKACADSCSYCTHISIGLHGYNFELPDPPPSLTNTAFSPQPFDPGYTPTPHPPKQHHS
ncbi:hypothetical protein ACFL3U_05970 [Pseudomonadota bacterium]